jgi:hypothetical protein
MATRKTRPNNRRDDDCSMKGPASIPQISPGKRLGIKARCCACYGLT